MPDGWDGVTELLDYPMFVVTTSAGGRRGGCLVGFSSQVSIHPPRYLLGLSNKNATYRVATGAHRLVVHVLARGQRDLAELFGATTGDDVDKFERCRWHEGPDGVPVLDEAIAWFTGPVIAQHPVGDHVGFVIEIDGAEVATADADLLTFRDVADLDPGHEA